MVKNMLINGTSAAAVARRSQKIGDSGESESKLSAARRDRRRALFIPK